MKNGLPVWMDDWVVTTSATIAAVVELLVVEVVVVDVVVVSIGALPLSTGIPGEATGIDGPGQNVGNCVANCFWKLENWLVKSGKPPPPPPPPPKPNPKPPPPLFGLTPARSWFPPPLLPPPNPPKFPNPLFPPPKPLPKLGNWPKPGGALFGTLLKLKSPWKGFQLACAPFGPGLTALWSLWSTATATPHNRATTKNFIVNFGLRRVEIKLLPAVTPH